MYILCKSLRLLHMYAWRHVVCMCVRMCECVCGVFTSAWRGKRVGRQTQEGVSCIFLSVCTRESVCVFVCVCTRVYVCVYGMYRGRAEAPLAEAVPTHRGWAPVRAVRIIQHGHILCMSRWHFIDWLHGEGKSDTWGRFVVLFIKIL